MSKDTLRSHAYFESHGMPVKEILRRGKLRFGLTPYMVDKGMEKVWLRIQDGEKISPKKLAWEAWDEAKAIDNRAYSIAKNIFEQQRLDIKRLTRERNLAFYGVVFCIYTICYLIWWGFVK